jgi:hypothetical protein
MTLGHPNSNGIAILLALMTNMTAAAVAEEHQPGQMPPVDGVRRVLPLNSQWEFSGSNIALQEVRETVDLPHTCNDVALKEGNNVVAASSGGESDTVVWMRSGPGMQIARIAITVMSHLVGIIAGGAVSILVLVVLARRAAPSTGRRLLWKTLGWLFLVIYLLFWAGILYLLSQGMNPFNS